MNRETRLNEAYESLRGSGSIHTRQDVSDKIGSNKSRVSRAFNGDPKYLTDGFIEDFCKAFPQINPVWLSTGEGEMLKKGEETKTTEQVQPNQPDEAIVVGSVPQIPLLPISAQGGTLIGFCQEGIKSIQCEMIDSPIRGAEIALSVSGDSMAPEYPSGCKVLVKRINESLFIEWGRAYVLDTENGAVIKQLYPSDKGSGCVKCVSVNPNYPPFDVDLSNGVFGVWRVLMMLAEK